MAKAQEGTSKSLGHNEGTGGSRRVPVQLDEDCVLVRDVLDRVGDKWSVLTIVFIGRSTRRFSELRRSIDGISQRMLTLTLRGLERDGIVTRTVYATVPPRVEYALTELGHTLLRAVIELATWAGRHGREIQRARDLFDERERAAPAPVRASGQKATSSR